MLLRATGRRMNFNQLKLVLALDAHLLDYQLVLGGADAAGIGAGHEALAVVATHQVGVHLDGVTGIVGRGLVLAQLDAHAAGRHAHG